MTFPDWTTIAAAIGALFTGSIWLGRQQQRLNHHDVQIEDLDAKVSRGLTALHSKMDTHTNTSADQWAQVQRALGRLEGKLGTKPNETESS